MDNGTGFQIPYPIDVINPVSVDVRYGKYDSILGKTVPFIDIAEAMDLVKRPLRFEGCTCLIVDEEYWWLTDLDIDPIKKTSGIKRPEPIIVLGQPDYTINWDADKIKSYGKHGHFEIWQGGERASSTPITRTVDGSGNPTSYTFILDGIDSEIHII